MATTTTTTLQNSNFLQPTSFKVIVYRKRFANIEFFAQTVSHPGVSMSPAQLSFRKDDAFEPGDKLVYDDLTIDAIMDEDMFVYQEMLNWMTGITEQSKVGSFGRFQKSAEQDNHEYDLKLIVMNNANIATREITYKNAFPISVGTINLATNSGTIEPITIPLSFKYNTFSFE